MKTWQWLYHPAQAFNWRFVISVIVRAVILFVALNLLFAVLMPLPSLGKLSAYNVVLDGRARLPYGENPAESYNLSLFNLPAMFASHEIAGSDDNEFRVILIGDSATWGILQRPAETLAAQITALGLEVDGRPVRAYNIGYPTMSLTKDLLLLDEALTYKPDLVIWLFTLESFGQRAQLDSALVQHNPDRVRDLIARYDLAQDPDDARLEKKSFWDKTIVGERRALADLLRLQAYGVTWSTTGVDQIYPDDYTRAAVDLAENATWHGLEPDAFVPGDLAFDVLAAGIARAGEVPMLLVNEPMLISDGENSDIRYNFYFPRTIYDDYRTWLNDRAGAGNWPLLDLWDLIPAPSCYTDSAVHLTPDCVLTLAEAIEPAILVYGGE